MLAKLRIAALMLCPILMGQGPADDGRWYAGAYSFSDEIGGFRILSVIGIGTREDPFLIVQEFDSATPAVMVIRAARPLSVLGSPPAFANGMMYVEITVINASGMPWIAFELELQHHLGQPSTFGDGLSFDQRQADGGELGSDSYERFERDFEPYDRVRFVDGVIDPSAAGKLRMFITDFTPTTTFYLKLDPQAPYA